MKEKKRLPLHVKIIIALILGIAWAFLSTFFGWTKFTADWINPWGTIFIRVLKFIAVPLVLFSIVSGVASLPDISNLGKMGIKTLVLYLFTTVLSVTVGLLLVNLFQPGKTTDKALQLENRLSYEIWANDAHIPIKDGKNFLKTATPAQIESVRKKMSDDENNQDYQAIASKNTELNQLKDTAPLQPLVDMVPENIFQSFSDGKLMLQVIFFALFFGIVLALLPITSTKEVVGFISGMNEVFIKMVEITMLAAPFFVFCLMAGVMSKMGGSISEMLTIFMNLGKYALVVVLGLATMLLIVYPLMLRIFKTGFSLKSFYKAISPAQFLAFSTSSSAATLPVTIECVEENLGVSNRVSSFVLPIGATVNMDGTSLYQAVAVVFLAQLHHIDLSFAQQAGIVATATLASIGSAAVPSAGLVMLAIVLDSIGLNPMWIAIIFPIDRLLDMCRTVVNVTSDATVASIVGVSEKD